MNARLTFRIPIALALLLALGACSTAPRRNAAMDEARGLHQRAQSNPEVSRYAAEEMARADVALASAERAWSARKPVSEVNHLAYMAGRHVSIAEATASSRTSQAAVDGAAAERDQLRLSLRTREADSARRQADRSRMDAGDARRDAATARSEIDSLEAELASLNARRTAEGLVVTLGDVLFDTARFTVRPEGNANLRQIADVLRSHPGYRAVIEGHTDNVGSASSNYLLSERRANAVMQALTSFGAPAAQLATRARGQEFPSASNETASGRQMNRRVEVIFSAIEPGVALR
jgi:outer membrane protein OmpA-like peptidoglycan-associated protein